MSSLEILTNKIQTGIRLDKEDLVFMLTEADLISLGHLADTANQQINHGMVSFSEHRYVRCPSEKGLTETAYQERLLSRAKSLITPTTTEIRLISVRPKSIAFQTLARLIQSLKMQFPKRQIRCLSAFQVLQYSLLENLPPLELLRYLKDSGLDSLEGRGLKKSDLFALSKWEGKKESDAYTLWFDIHKEAHKMGICSDATIAYGKGPGQKGLGEIEQLVAIRKVQDETGGFSSLIPLNPSLGLDNESWRPRLAMTDLRFIAASRLYLDNIPNIKAQWGRLGINLAQLALNFGANYLEGSLSTNNNSRIAGGRPFRSMNRQEIHSLIVKSSLLPKEKSLPLSQDEKESLAHQDKEEKESVKALLYKLTSGVELDNEQKLLICRRASLLDLAVCASDIKKGLMPKSKMSLLCPHIYLTVKDLQEGVFKTPVFSISEESPFALVIDLGLATSEPLTLKSLEKCINHYRTFHPKVDVSLLGIKGLWALAQKEKVSLLQLGQILKDLSVVVIESSSKESEDDLTPSEIRNTHMAFHEVDITTVGKIEIAAPYHGQGEPFWQNLLERIQIYNQIQLETHGLRGIKVESARGASISPSEYLRASCVARIFLKEILNIVTPLKEFPLVNEQKDKESFYRKNTTLKLAPLAALFGSNDLNDFYEPNGLKDYKEALSASHIKLLRRSAHFYPYTFE